MCALPSILAAPLATASSSGRCLPNICSRTSKRASIAAIPELSVDEVVPQTSVVARAIERAEYLSLRSKKSLGAIKRSVYFGSSLTLEEGLQLEHAEFVVLDQSKEAQQLMLKYIAATETTGDLPLMNRKTYARALSTGRLGD